MSEERTRPSSGHGIAARIAGLTLILTATAALLTALGQLDDKITPKTKKYIVEPMFALGIASRPETKTVDSQRAHVNGNQQHNEDFASLMIPAGADIIEPPHVLLDQAPNCSAQVDMGPPRASPGANGETHYLTRGTAGGCGTGNATAVWHLHTVFVDLGHPLELTIIGRIVLAILFIWGLIWTFRPSLKKRCRF
jgi:hypothetical protein